MIRRSSPLLLLVIFVQSFASGDEWLCAKAEPSSVPAGICQFSTWSWTASDGTKRAFSSTSLVLADSVRLKLVEQRASDQIHAKSVVTQMAEVAAVAAINGGYFTKEFAPSGLLMIDGNIITPKNDEAALSGILVIGGDGKLSLRARGDDLAGAASARQAGPFIIDPGGSVGIKPSEHPAFARRSFVMISKSGQVALVATSDVSLYDLASCLHDHADGFGVEGVERALNLDGGPSTAMSVAGLKDPVVFKEKAAVRDVLVVLPPVK